MSKVKFKKITFNMQLVDGSTRETAGYLFEIDGLDFDFIAHRLANNSKLWGVSEHLTGALVSNAGLSFTTRKQAVNDTIWRLIPHLISRLIELVDEINHVNKPLKEAIK